MNMSNTNNNINNHTNDNNNNDNNNNDISPKTSSVINAMKSIIVINNTHKRKDHNNDTLINNNSNNNNINLIEPKKIKYSNYISNNNNSTLHADDVLIGGILSSCLSYLKLKELNLVVTRVNKYWSNHTYNNITLGYRIVNLLEKKCKLLSQYLYNSDSNRSNYEAVNLLKQIKYTSHLYIYQLSSSELLLNLLKQAKYLQSLMISFTPAFNYLVITDQSLHNIRLDKLQSLQISFALSDTETATGEVCDYLLRKLMKCVDLHKITDICLLHTPIHSKPLQVFENNPFNNLTNLTFSPRLQPNDPLNDSFKYLSGLTQLITLRLDCVPIGAVDFDFPVQDWIWLSKLVNLENLSLVCYDSNFDHSNPTEFVEVTTSLPKLKDLNIPFSLSMLIISGHLFSKFKTLTALSLNCGSNGDKSKIRDIEFPTIPTLIKMRMDTCYAECIIPILMSNPQIQSISSTACEIEAGFMAKILECAPSLLDYDLSECADFSLSYEVDPIIFCCEAYPDPLVTVDHGTHIIFIEPANVSRQALINRIKQHWQPDYECFNSECSTHNEEQLD